MPHARYGLMRRRSYPIVESDPKKMEENSIFNSMEEAASAAVKVLREGGVILYPTETVWGLGCDATNEDAVKRLCEIKSREEGKPMLVLVDSEGTLGRYVDDVPDAAWQLIDAAVDPITIIYDHGRGFASGVTADDGSIGIRITSDPFCRKLCSLLRRPIVSTSANKSGEQSPRSWNEISSELKEKVDLSACFPRTEKSSSGKASNVIKVSEGGVIKILR